MIERPTILGHLTRNGHPPKCARNSGTITVAAQPFYLLRSPASGRLFPKDCPTYFQKGMIIIKEMPVIYTHDEAARIMDIFESVLEGYNIHVPSPEDDDRDEDDMIGLYGSTYSDIFDDVENAIIGIIEKTKSGFDVVKYVFGGTI